MGGSEMLSRFVDGAIFVMVSGGIAAAFIAWACCAVGGRSERK